MLDYLTFILLSSTYLSFPDPNNTIPDFNLVFVKS